MCQALSDTKLNKKMLVPKKLMVYWSGGKYNDGKKRHRMLWKCKERVLWREES